MTILTEVTTNQSLSVMANRRRILVSSSKWRQERLSHNLIRMRVEEERMIRGLESLYLCTIFPEYALRYAYDADVAIGR